MTSNNDAVFSQNGVFILGVDSSAMPFWKKKTKQHSTTLCLSKEQSVPEDMAGKHFP